MLKNGIDISKFSIKMSQKDIDHVRKQIGLNSGDFVVVFCGRLIKEKGVLELVQAIKKINNKKIKLVIIGSVNFALNVKNEYTILLNQEIDSSKGRVLTTGYINNEEIYKYYKSADIGIIPSVCEDAAPLVPVEMMASGLPIIITKSGGAPEYVSKETIIISKDNKIVDNIASEIVFLFNNRERLSKMKISGLEHSKKIKIEYFCKNFFDILNKDKD